MSAAESSMRENDKRIGYLDIKMIHTIIAVRVQWRTRKSSASAHAEPNVTKRCKSLLGQPDAEKNLRISGRSRINGRRLSWSLRLLVHVDNVG